MIESPAPATSRPNGADGAPPPRRVVRVGSLEAVRRHPLLALAPLVALTALALAYGLTRSPTYTAESRLSVSRIGLTSPGALNGFPIASAALASTYSRAIGADPLVTDVARRTGHSASEIRRVLTSTPVPSSPIIRVMATGDSEQEAIRTANDGSAALQRYITRLNNDNPNAVRLRERYREASLLAAKRRRERDRLESVFGRTPNAQESRRLAAIDAKVDEARLQTQILRTALTDAESTQSTASILQRLSGASVAVSDRFSRLQLLVFIGVAAGSLLGIALATLWANRVARRRAIG